MSEVSLTRRDGSHGSGLGEEIVILRQLMRQLMADEEDLARLVAGVTRLSAALVEVVRVERLLEERPDDRMREAINRAWADLERQEALEAGAGEGV